MRSLIFILILFSLSACDRQPAAESSTSASSPAVAEQLKKKCSDCHESRLDPSHASLSCTGCHGGSSPAADRESAHAGLIRFPAHPDMMEQTCAPCHPQQVHDLRHAAHFTMRNMVNLVRDAYGADEKLDSMLDVPPQEEIGTVLDLADDMLRRRCLRCHLYSPGDRYPQTTHGTGCAACHLIFSDGKATSHAFIRSPGDEFCLHCHYGNYVGADYHGRFEHDHHWDFRTPYAADGHPPRPYGIEYHQLASDVHQQAGMLCIDCHGGDELMRSAPGPSCEGCHDPQDNTALAPGVRRGGNNQLLLVRHSDGKELNIPRPTHAAHEKWKGKADCAVCHAQWSFADIGTHLLRLDVEEFDPWAALSVQGSREVEEQIDTSLYSDRSLPYVAMRDGINGELYSGLWLMGYELRRWERPIVRSDDSGRLRIHRPLLDLHLSFVNEEEQVVFNAVIAPKAPVSGLLPYTPHTIGKAGSFFSNRLRDTSSQLSPPRYLSPGTISTPDGKAP